MVTMRSSRDLEPDLAALPATDLAYLLTVCGLPYAYRTWGERAESALATAIDTINSVVPGGMRDGYRVQHYHRAARNVWQTYTWEETLA